MSAEAGAKGSDHAVCASVRQHLFSPKIVNYWRRCQEPHLVADLVARHVVPAEFGTLLPGLAHQQQASVTAEPIEPVSEAK